MGLGLFITIKFEDKEYKVDLEKICFVLEKLHGSKISTTNVDEICKLLQKYNLYDSDFLENINKL